jgi:hypothetical protein
VLGCRNFKLAKLSVKLDFTKLGDLTSSNTEDNSAYGTFDLFIRDTDYFDKNTFVSERYLVLQELGSTSTTITVSSDTLQIFDPSHQQHTSKVALCNADVCDVDTGKLSDGSGTACNCWRDQCVPAGFATCCSGDASNLCRLNSFVSGNEYTAYIVGRRQSCSCFTVSNPTVCLGGGSSDSCKCCEMSKPAQFRTFDVAERPASIGICQVSDTAEGTCNLITQEKNALRIYFPPISNQDWLLKPDTSGTPLLYSESYYVIQLSTDPNFNSNVMTKKVCRKVEAGVTDDICEGRLPAGEEPTSGNVQVEVTGLSRGASYKARVFTHRFFDSSLFRESNAEVTVAGAPDPPSLSDFKGVTFQGMDLVPVDLNGHACTAPLSATVKELLPSPSTNANFQRLDLMLPRIKLDRGQVESSK